MKYRNLTHEKLDGRSAKHFEYKIGAPSNKS